MKQKLVEVFVDCERDRRWLAGGYGLVLGVIAGVGLLMH
jgi:hypothetical protein